MVDITESEYASLQSVAQPMEAENIQAEPEPIPVGVYSDTELIKTAILHLQGTEGEMAEMLGALLHAALPFVETPAPSLLSFEHDLALVAVQVSYGVIA